MLQVKFLQSRNRDTDIKNGWVDTEGKGEGGMNREIRIEIYTLIHTYIYIYICVKYIASGNLLYSPGSSAQCSVMT